MRKTLNQILNQKLLFWLMFLIFTFLFIWAQNFKSLQPPSASEYAPNFWFDSREKYFPTDPLDFYFENDQEVEGRKAVEKYDHLSTDEKLSKIKLFFTIKDIGDEWVYEYWLFYVLNDFINEHFGDWESVFIFVDKLSKKITKVIGSAHGLGNELVVRSENKHLWVYIGKGSHANCPDEPPDEKCNFRSWNIREKWDGTKS